MKKLLSIFACTICFSNEVDTLLNQAQVLENDGNYKEAMLLYKKVANLKTSKEDAYVIKVNEKKSEEELETFTNMKKAFFERHIDNVDDEETEKNLHQLVTKDFGLYAYKKNYVLPATYTFNDFDNRHNFETSFQLSVEKPFSYNFFGFDETISLAYTQKSFWQTTKHSAPFRESNYEPELFVHAPIDGLNILKSAKVSFMHSSNGRSDELSRSLNRIYLEGYFQISNLFLIPRVWYRIPETTSEDNNKDFYKYYGYGDLSFLYAYKKHTFEVLLRNNLKPSNSNKGAVEFNWTFPLPNFIASKNTYGLFQAFHGYGQSLIDYDQEVTNVGVGITFSR